MKFYQTVFIVLNKSGILFKNEFYIDIINRLLYMEECLKFTAA